MTPLDDDAIQKMLAGEKVTHELEELANMLGTYLGHLVMRGFSREEAFALVAYFQGSLFEAGNGDSRGHRGDGC